METDTDRRFCPHHGLERSRSSHPPKQILLGDTSKGERRRCNDNARWWCSFTAAWQLSREVTTTTQASRQWFPLSPLRPHLLSLLWVLGSCRGWHARRPRPMTVEAAFGTTWSRSGYSGLAGQHGVEDRRAPRSTSVAMPSPSSGPNDLHACRV